MTNEIDTEAARMYWPKLMEALSAEFPTIPSQGKVFQNMNRTHLFHIDPCDSSLPPLLIDTDARTIKRASTSSDTIESSGNWVRFDRPFIFAITPEDHP
jgi:hypothetical protein